MSDRIVEAKASECAEFAFVWTSIFIPANSISRMEYYTVAQRVMFEGRYICFVGSLLAWWEVSFGPFGFLDRVCRVHVLFSNGGS